MWKLIEWPDYDQADAFRFNKVINEPDFLPLHAVRQLAQAATLVGARRGKLVATPLDKSMLSDARQGTLLAILFHLAFWHMGGGRCISGGPCRGELFQSHHDPRLMSWSHVQVGATTTTWPFSPCSLCLSAASIAKSTASDWLL